MAGERDELAALRRLAELEARSGVKEDRGPARAPAAYDPMTATYADFLKPKPPWRDASGKLRLDAPEGLGLEGLSKKVGTDVTDIATNLGASPEVAAGAGTAANFLTSAVPAFASAYKFVSSPTPSLLEGPARRLMQSAVKPPTSMGQGEINQAMGTMLHEGLTPGNAVSKGRNLVNQLHTGVEADIAASPATVGAGDIGQKYLSQYDTALRQTGGDDLKLVQDVWQRFAGHPGVGTSEGPMTVQMAHMLKQGTQQAIGNKNYGELKGAEIEAQKALARYLRQGVGEAVPSVVEPLKRESDIMRVLDMAQTRAIAESNKNPMGLGSLRLDDLTSAAGFAVDRSSALKAALARMLYGSGQPRVALPMTQGITAYGQQQNEALR